MKRVITFFNLSEDLSSLSDLRSSRCFLPGQMHPETLINGMKLLELRLLLAAKEMTFHSASALLYVQCICLHANMLNEDGEQGIQCIMYPANISGC